MVWRKLWSAPDFLGLLGPRVWSTKTSRNLVLSKSCSKLLKWIVLPKSRSQTGKEDEKSSLKGGQFFQEEREQHFSTEERKTPK